MPRAQRLKWRASFGLPLFLGAVSTWSVVWLLWIFPDALTAQKNLSWQLLLSLVVLYGGAHIVRMLRLALLCLDERRYAGALMAAHGLTGFLSSMVPFKGGEILRVAAFLQVFDRTPKALAVWLAERFSDAVVLSTLIAGLYFLRVPLPPRMEHVLVFFVAACAAALLALFATSTVLVYLNRHLVLSSHSRRGLWILRSSAVLRMLELEIYRSVEGRLAGVFLLTVLVWGLEFWALWLLMANTGGGQAEAVAAFTASMTGGLPGNESSLAAFGLYQSLSLVVLTLLTAVVLACFVAMRGGATSAGDGDRQRKKVL